MTLVAKVDVAGGALPVDHGGGAILGGLVETDPVRYGTLTHPGDAYSYDIFRQAGTALLAADGPSPLGDLEPSYLIATGESQSARFLTTYINAIHPRANIYDGFFVHSRGGSAPGLGGSNGEAGPSISGVQIVAEGAG